MNSSAKVISEVDVGTRDLRQFLSVYDEARIAETLERAARLKELIGDHTIWNVNSTAVGGGVAEMLQPMLALARGLGIDARWLVINGSPEFFQLTKRIHHALHGQSGDGSDLGQAQREVYEATLRANSDDLCSRVKPGDFVMLHDPQTAGLASDLMRLGAHVIWRCHIGHDSTNGESDLGWDFLRPYIEDVPAFVFTRRSYAPSWCDADRVVLVQPSIDAFSTKNQDLDPDTVRSILVQTELIDGPMPKKGSCLFIRTDGKPGRVERRTDVDRLDGPPPQGDPMIVQVSRWDPLKDMMGVMRGFARMLERAPDLEAQLVLAGPSVHSVADDPEAPQVFEEVLAEWRQLPEEIRKRIHLANLPTDDVDENATIVNALQRHAAIVVQKSFQEGFGLTVTEAMWKGRPVVASAVGGIVDQIEDGVTGCLLQDPNDLDSFADMLEALIRDPNLRDRIGTAARERVREQFLSIRHLDDYAALIEKLVD